MRALAIIPAFNEADIIGWSVSHLIEQGLAVHVIDCQSTDATMKVALKAGAAVESYYVPNGRVSWRAILQRVETLAANSIGIHHWVMWQDADEIRRSPIEGERLLEAFERMDSEGYNAAQLTVWTYHPTDNGYDGSQNPEKYFRHYTRDTFNERIGQVKAWKNDRKVELSWSGGHRIRFIHPEGCKCGMCPPSAELPQVHPMNLVSGHYPIRSQAHGERKVFRERRGRWSDPESDWHVQYAGIEPGHNFLKER